MNYSTNNEETEFTIAEQIAVLDSKITKAQLKKAGNVGLALVSPLLSVILNSKRNKVIKELKKEREELQKQLKK